MKRRLAGVRTGCPPVICMLNARFSLFLRSNGSSFRYFGAIDLQILSGMVLNEKRLTAQKQFNCSVPGKWMKLSCSIFDLGYLILLTFQDSCLKRCIVTNYRFKFLEI